MNLVSREDVGRLMLARDGWCVSMYMPTHRFFPESKHDKITFKNLVRQAEAQLGKCGLRTTEVSQILMPVRKLLDDSFFWQHQSDGLAIFASSQDFCHYSIPIAFKKLLVVAGRFHIKPLLSLMSNNERFFIIALSQNQVRFFKCSHFSIKELELSGVPLSLSEALKYDDPQKQLQWHTQTPGKGGQRQAMFHGQGVGIDDSKNNILRFFQQVDHGLKNVLRQEQAPLVFVGVDYLFPIFREACSYQFLIDRGIVGNPEEIKSSDMHTKAWEIVKPYFLERQKETIAKYRKLEGTNQTVRTVESAVMRAYEGRVDTLFVALGEQLWGRFDTSSGVVITHEEPEPGDEDILDLSAVYTILNGGTVFAISREEIPGNLLVAALIR